MRTLFTLLAATLMVQAQLPSPTTSAVILNDRTTIRWDPHGDTNVVGYELRLTTPAGRFTNQIQNRLTASIPLTSITTNLQPGTYTGELVAVSNAGLRSETATVTTNGVAVPAAPMRFRFEGTIQGTITLEP